MRSLKNVAPLALIVFAVVACTDATDRGLTAPGRARYSHTASPAATLALINEINAAIACVYAQDPKQVRSKLKDFAQIVRLRDKHKDTDDDSDSDSDKESKNVSAGVNQFVRDSEKLIAKGKLTAACGGGDLAVAAQELYNLLYLYSDQPQKVETPPYAGDAEVAVCLPGAACELKGEGAAIVVPVGAFDVPVIISFRQIIEPAFDYTPFNAFGTPVPPPYEFSVHPNIAANPPGWGRYICVSHDETENGTLQLFREAPDGTVEAIPLDDSYIVCPHNEYAQISNPVLRGAYRLASLIAAPFAPNTAYAAQHRAIGGPGIFASPHVVVRLEEVEPPAVVSNGTVSLGVNQAGHLNLLDGGSASSGTGVTTVGIRYVPTNADALSPGCHCEGWGVADAATGVTGYANQNEDPQMNNISVQSFTTTETNAISVVTIGSTFRVTHNYHPSPATPYLYEVTVAIKNISEATVADVRYRRVLDWDVEPTAFSEFVTIQGTSGASAVLFASDNGFASANPLSGPSQILFSGDAVNSGPTDHGALFDFGFGSLAPGATKTFKLFYGAAGSESNALSALSAVGAEVYSLGEPNVSPFDGTPNTFMIGFTGVGGTSLVPSASLVPNGLRIAPSLVPSEGARNSVTPRPGTPDPRNVRRR